jgi:uncharacterized membrane protein
MASLALEQPAWVAATAAALAAAALIARATLSNLPGSRRAASLALRSLALAGIGLALAGPRAVSPSTRQCVLFAVDWSDSIPVRDREAALARVREVLARLPADDLAGLIVFGEQAHLEEAPSVEPRFDGVRSRVAGTGTDLAAALRLAQATFPPGVLKRLVLISDGNETAGRADDEIAALAASGVQVMSLPVGPEAIRDVLVDRVIVPERVQEGGRHEVKVLLASTYSGSGSLKLYRDQEYLGAAPVSFAPGARAPYTFTDTAPGKGIHTYRAVVEPDGEDGPRANNAGEAFTRTEGPPRVLYVHGAPAPATAFLRELAATGFTVDSRAVAAVPGTLAQMASYQVVVLDNVNGPSLTREQHRILAAYVKDLGGGLAMLGGDHAFGAGGYYGSPVEEVLPVSMDLSRKKYRPRATMAVVIDKSGSMAAEEAGVQKIQLAAEGAVNVARLLKPGDRFGVNATDTTVQWVVPLSEVPGEPGGRAGASGAGEAFASAIRTLTAGGGGILVYTALRATYEALRDDTSQVRHILLFSDTSDSEQPVGEGGEHVFDLARRGAAARITLSVVGIGKHGDKDMELLEGLARSGSGRFYFTEDAGSVPQIFSQDALLASRSVIVEKRVSPRLHDRSELMRGLTDAAPPPPVDGYVATSARPLARVALMVGEDDPLLAHWSCGLGRSLAFTSDVRGAWTRDWLGWSGYGKIFAQGVAWLAGAQGRSDLPVTVTVSGRRGTVTVEALDEDGGFVNFLALRAHVAPPGLRGGVAVDLAQTAPGRYEATFPAHEEGTYLVNVVRLANGVPVSSQLAGCAMTFSLELRSSGPNLPVLARIAGGTGGRLLAGTRAERAPVRSGSPMSAAAGRTAGERGERPSADSGGLAVVFEHDRPPPAVPREVWDLLVCVALLAFVADVAVRRVSLSAGALFRAASAVRERVAAMRGAAGATGEDAGSWIARLKAARSGRSERPRASEASAHPSGQVPAPVCGGDASPARSEGPPLAGQPEGVSRLLAAKRRAHDQRRQDGPGG